MATQPPANPFQPRPDLEAPYRSPSGATETTLESIWTSTLGLDQVGVNDDFFELGGDSFLAAAVAVAAGDAFDLSLPLNVLYTYPTIAALSVALGGAQPASAAIPRARRQTLTELAEGVAEDFS